MTHAVLSLALALSLIVTADPASGADDMLTAKSAHSASATLEKLETALRSRGFTVLMRIDHAEAGLAAVAGEATR